MGNLYIAYFSYSVMEWYENQLWKLSWTQIHVQTQIRLNMILTLATKHFMIINKDNLYLHLKVF